MAIIASCAAAVSLTAALLTRGRRIKRRVTETETLREEMAVLSLGLNPQLTGVWVKVSGARKANAVMRKYDRCFPHACSSCMLL